MGKEEGKEEEKLRIGKEGRRKVGQKEVWMKKIQVEGKEKGQGKRGNRIR